MDFPRALEIGWSPHHADCPVSPTFTQSLGSSDPWARGLGQLGEGAVPAWKRQLCRPPACCRGLTDTATVCWGAPGSPVLLTPSSINSLLSRLFTTQLAGRLVSLRSLCWRYKSVKSHGSVYPARGTWLRHNPSLLQHILCDSGLLSKSPILTFTSIYCFPRRIKESFYDHKT